MADMIGQNHTNAATTRPRYRQTASRPRLCRSSGRAKACGSATRRGAARAGPITSPSISATAIIRNGASGTA
ncbi:Uncharacterised protein [Mycobacteroides abscessus subsp. abscessus]|nr:Uncharacterised protein [Mycobacteroides abscessus subsp. abscessus]